MSETCPTFLVRGDSIEAVGFTEWEESAPDQWNVVGEVTIPLEGRADRIVFELPVGCFQIDGNWGNGSITIIGNGRGNEMVSECHNKPGFTQAEEIICEIPKQSWVRRSLDKLARV